MGDEGEIAKNNKYHKIYYAIVNDTLNTSFRSGTIPTQYFNKSRRVYTGGTDQNVSLASTNYAKFRPIRGSFPATKHDN